MENKISNGMKLSIVIPAHNEEAYLGLCLESIFKECQEKNYDMEVIVVNNASSDRTKEVAEKFNGVKIVDEPRKGLPRARQAGFEASGGELIANVDADTIMPGGWIDKVFHEFSQNEKLVALSGPFVFYDLSKYTNFFVQSFFYLGFLSNLVGYYIFRGGAVLQGGNFIVRRHALKKIGGFNVDLPFFGEDADIAHRIGKLGRVKFTVRLPIYTSARRLKAEGVFMTGLRATLDYLWMGFSKKPYRKTIQADIRAKK